MTQTNTDVTTLTGVELKAIAFEQSLLRDQSIQNIQNILAELARRQQAAFKPE